MIYTKVFTLPPFNEAEIRRYAGIGRETLDAQSVEDCLSQCMNETKDIFQGTVCYVTVPIRVCGDEVDLQFAKVKSKALAKNLSGCEKAVVFAATAGIQIDRLIVKYQKKSISKALFMQAIGAERVESLCDVFCDWLKEEGEKQKNYLRPRFSPGYGDLPLEFQKDMVKVLDCTKKIGVSLNESLLMTPSKSVTAIVGMGKLPCEENKLPGKGCDSCSKRDCDYRKVK
ncbi:MAG: Vitamin B12 dependent methionine synthase activation subunit [Lachnospiraceae bacterium]|nr:Vitamin B12 dependent methionine synthase activation subunit [Lachnospiraceae bacterium]